MKKGQNYNRPKVGSHIAVDPIRNLKDIQSISKMLSSSPRNHLLFVIGVNNGLRTGDILNLYVGAVSEARVGETITILERKTKKRNILVINKTIYKSLQNYFEKEKPKITDYLFPSRKGNKPITVQHVNNMMKRWAKAINMKGNYGAHSLRKTWGYIQRTVYGVGFEVLCKRFNHSSPAITMRYLGIEDKEVQNILMNEVG